MENSVRKIIRAVARRGDQALLEYTRRLDRFRLSANRLEVTRAERRGAWKKADPRVIAALKIAANRIRRFHERQVPKGWTLAEPGIKTGLRWTPLDKVGIYVPGGRASYPSTVLMNAIPARLAGVGEIIMATPAPEGVINPVTLVAAEIAGVDRIFRIGGAQAVAAMAYGTKTIPRVDKIVGPGNVYVAEAKRQLFGTVGIDSIAGPSELVVIADDSANPVFVAADLVAQAEHDPEARPTLISPSAKMIRRVAREVERQVKRIGRRAIAERAFRRHGTKIKVRNLAEACQRANQIAPEHLSLQVRNPKGLLKKIRHAGAIFLGPYSAVALGDYITGPNHVLPTAGTARFSSPLGVYDFMKATSVVEINPAGLKKLAPAADRLARSEGLTAHAKSVEVRLFRRS